MIKRWFYIAFHTVLFVLFFGIATKVIYGELSDVHIFTLSIVGLVDAKFEWHTM